MRLFLKPLVTALLGALMFVGCGVTADDAPRNIAPSEVPFDLLTPTSSTSTAVPRATMPAEVFLLRGSRLEAAPRQVASPSTVGTVMAALVQGPTGEESERGLRSAVTPETSILSAEVVNGAATINVSEAFSRVGVRDQISALAQVVYTATNLPSVDRVQILLDGQVVQVPRADGTSTDAPLRRSDYSSFAPVLR